MYKKTIFIIILIFFFPKFLFSALLSIFSSSDNYLKQQKEKSIYLTLLEAPFGVVYDLKHPEKAFLITPDNTTIKVFLLRKNFFDKALNLERIGYEIKFIPQKKGDYLLCIQSTPYLTKEQRLIQDFAKAYFHVEQEKGWTNLCGFNLEIIPYTRPYGLQVGDIFWGKVLYNNKALKKGIITLVYLNLDFINWEDLPKDAQGEINYPILKKKVRLSSKGEFVVNFNKSGWWAIYIEIPKGFKTYGNQQYPFFIRAILSLYIFP